VSETNRWIASSAVQHGLEYEYMQINQFRLDVMDNYEGKNVRQWNELVIFVAVQLQSQMESPGETRAGTSE
jgi:hypothetical protein